MTLRRELDPRVHRRRYAWRNRILGHRQPEFGVPFICGATRSGSTLLRLMLDAHPQLAIPSETHFIVPLMRLCERRRISVDRLTEAITDRNRWGDFGLDEADLRDRLQALDRLNAADTIREFFALYAQKQGKERWGDKTPGYIKHMRKIQRVLPEVRFIHLVRDGRDVALSVLPMSWGPNTVPEAAELWTGRIRRARRQAPDLHHYLEIRYEDLITETEATLRRICDFIELEFDPAMLSYHETAEERLSEKARDLHYRGGKVQPAQARMDSHKLATEPPRPERVARWRTAMSEPDRAAYEEIAGHLLTDLGYELSAGPPR